MKRWIALVLVAAALHARTQDNALEIITRDPRDVRIAPGQWTTVATVNPHDGFGRSYTADDEDDGGDPEPPCEDPPCTTYGEFSLILSLTGFPELNPTAFWPRPFQASLNGTDDEYNVRVRARRYDHANAEPGQFAQEGNFKGTAIHALCKPDGDDYEAHAMACSKIAATWPPEAQWPDHQKIQYWERTGGTPGRTYYVEGPFLVQAYSAGAFAFQGVVRIQYHGYTDVVGGGDRREVVEYAEVTVRYP